MRLTFHGAVRTVTGSQHLITINGKNILLDCGMYQGKRSESYSRNQNFTYDPSKIDILVLSHAHIDHSGNIPNLVKQGFKGDIVCTYATRDLATVMLRDSAKIQQYDAEFVNKKRKKRNEPPIEPIYTMEDAVQSLKYFIGLGYDRPREIMPGVELTFLDAGHILGSASVVLKMRDEDAKKDVTLVFSGDIGRPNRPILRDPVPATEADVLIIESTYGNRNHAPQESIDDKLKAIILKTIERRGKVIVPAFAVGRTQELVYRIHKMVDAGTLPNDLGIYVDSPMAIDATGVYRLHPEAYDTELEKFMLEDVHGDPFGFNMMKYTRSVEQSKAINKDKSSSVIISASGMAEAGRILHHLRNNVADKRNSVLITGWQAPHTLGRRLVEKSPTIKIFGEEHKLNAEVVTINGLSAHGDKDEMLDWASQIKERPKHTYIVHGEEEASEAFAQTLRSNGFKDVNVPELGQSFNIE